MNSSVLRPEVLKLLADLSRCREEQVKAAAHPRADTHGCRLWLSDQLREELLILDELRKYGYTERESTYSSTREPAD